MESVLSSILDAIGKTPLVALDRIRPPGYARVLAKVELLNPSGSVKARPAYAMVRAAERDGLLRSDSVLVEASSGNQGIALAMVGAVLGYRVRIVMPSTMSQERVAIMKAYGAEVVLSEPGSNIAEAIDNAITLTREMAAADPRVFLPDQFRNPANPASHYDETGSEILCQLGPDITPAAFVAGIGTGGSLSGIGRALRVSFPDLRVVAVEPELGAILSGGPVMEHIQQGIGDGLIPEVLDRSLIDEIIRVSDEDARAMAGLLARREGIFCGVSSGSNVAGALHLAGRLSSDEVILTLCPDTGERYLSLG